MCVYVGACCGECCDVCVVGAGASDFDGGCARVRRYELPYGMNISCPGAMSRVAVMLTICSPPLWYGLIFALLYPPPEELMYLATDDMAGSTASMYISRMTYNT